MDLLEPPATLADLLGGLIRVRPCPLLDLSFGAQPTDTLVDLPFRGMGLRLGDSGGRELAYGNCRTGRDGWM